MNLIFRFGFVISCSIEIFVSIDFIRKEGHPHLSLSLYLRIHLSSIPSLMFAPLHLCHIVVLFIHFLVEYHQSQNVKYSVTFCWRKQPTTHTHTFSFLNVDTFCSISNPIDRFDAYKKNTNSKNSIINRWVGWFILSDCLFPFASNYRYSC